MKMFEEMVRVQALDDDAIRSEFSTNKTNVLRVLKSYAFRELREEMEKEEEVLTRPKAQGKGRKSKKAKEEEAASAQPESTI
jgi:hypothetical protein